MSKNPLDRYVSIMRMFAADEMSPESFRDRYLGSFKSEEFFFPPEVFAILDFVFSEVDAFEPDAQVRAQNPAYFVDEQRLRSTVDSALVKLKEQIKQ